MSQPRPNYWDYIRVEELLSLQGGLGAGAAAEAELTNDEVLFITVHQVYELWFKLILRELSSMRSLLVKPVPEDQLSGAVHGARRVATILRRCVDHFEVVETLRTREYLAFRDKLSPASGFQSAQMRQIEIVMGLGDEERIPLGVGGNYQEALRAHDGSASSAYERVVEAKEQGVTLRDAVEEWLYRTPINGSGPDEPGAAEALTSFCERYREAHAAQVDASAAYALGVAKTDEDRERLTKRFDAEKQAMADFLDSADQPDSARRRRIRAAILLIVTFADRPLLAWPNALLSSLIELEQQFVVFRQRHARMVERVIGRRTGTGGSAGVDYLDQTALNYRVFRDLWAVRTFQVRESAAPQLDDIEQYGFVRGG